MLAVNFTISWVSWVDTFTPSQFFLCIRGQQVSGLLVSTQANSNALEQITSQQYLEFEWGRSFTKRDENVRMSMTYINRIA